MVIHQSEMKAEQKEGMRGGEGTVSLLHYVDGATMKNARLLSKIVIPPGASIGNHSHESETEYFIILEGTGSVDDDGVKKTVSAGDVVATGGGATHGIANAGTVPLVMVAVIVTY